MKSSDPRYALRYPSPPRWQAALLMFLASVGLIVLCGGWYTTVRYHYMHAAPVPVEYRYTEEIPLLSDTDENNGVISAACAFDKNGACAGYIIITAAQGYCSVIEVESVFTPDRQTLAYIRIVSQNETAYLGSRIKQPAFTNSFRGRKMPVKLWQSATVGAPVDGLSGSTVSSQAVVDAVNAAQYFISSLT